DRLIKELTQPVLGICLGMQLMCRWSEENDTECLGILDADVRRFRPVDGEKVPHMGWNTLSEASSPLFSPSMQGAYVYFVHSYYVESTSHTIATCHYGHPFSAAMQKDNFFATQFHPEKSGPIGAKILENFIQL
ncbi:MAG: imidazole glycerol phosphate synthase subunit HisH, partial [Saprospiraceae bacterium]|nr:imidazole glycerol phosphate synthase subunit HisH [Saprospiraceae bacterium]